MTKSNMKNYMYILMTMFSFLYLHNLEAWGQSERQNGNLYLFSQKVRESSPSPLYNFVEKYLSQLKAAGNNDKTNAKMKNDLFTIEYGSVASISLLHDSMEINILREKDKRYYITWTKDKQKIMSISFPVQYELILGLKKVEIEDLLKERLLAYKPQPIVKKISPNTLSATTQKDFFIEEKGFYQIDGMRADHYYLKSEAGYTLLADKNNPIETLANLMTTGQVKNNIRLTIIQRKYGNKQDTIQTTVNQWISFCKEEGCIPYLGIEEYDGKNIRATVIMENKILGYIHLFFFQFPAELLENKLKGDVTATLYSYIPVHNLNNLFDDYSIKLKQHTPKYHLSKKPYN